MEGKVQEMESTLQVLESKVDTFLSTIGSTGETIFKELYKNLDELLMAKFHNLMEITKTSLVNQEKEMKSFMAQTVAHQIKMKKSVKTLRKEIDDLKNQMHAADAKREKLEKSLVKIEDDIKLNQREMNTSGCRQNM